jgi:hypothetical protein
MALKTVLNRQSRGIGTAGFLFDENLARAALALAHPEIKTEEQAVHLFVAVAKGRVLWNEDNNTLVERGTPRFYTADWDIAQRWLQRFLPRIARADALTESSASALAQELTASTIGIGVGQIGVTRRGGRYDLVMFVSEDSIWQACTRAAIVFLPEYGWGRRLGQCEFRDCGRWFLRETKTGPRRQFCSDEHASLARSRRFRGTRA